MPVPSDVPAPDALTALLRRELKLDARRVRSIVRIAAATTIVVAIAMVFQIPLPAYMAYLVFLISQEDAASTVMFAVGGLVAVSVAVALSVLFYMCDASEPALRMPLLALSTFLGLFLSRASRLGPVAFLAGFVLVLSQTLIDDTPTTELLTHGLLWLWVVVAVPVLVTVLLHLLTGESPVALSRKRAADAMEALARYIEQPPSVDPAPLRNELLALNQLKNKALLWDKKLKAFAHEDQQLLTLVLEALQIARHLPARLQPASRHALADSLRQSRHRFLERRGLDGTPLPPHEKTAVHPSDPACAALQCVLDDVAGEAAGSTASSQAATATSTHRFFSPDAFENRAYVRFALKVTCAMLASYITYSLLDWPGIRTAVTTCFFVSLGTVGESVHKLTLRLTGALIGGLLAGLCIVFVLPNLTDIGQLCLLIAAVSAACAWISTGSETIAYAGMQTAFAFFLGVMQGYGPANDLTVLRDRVVGIMVGNLWMTVVFTTLWPVSAIQRTHALLSGALDKLSELLLARGATPVASLRLDVCSKISEASLLTSRARFEWRLMQPSLAPDALAHAIHDVEQLTSSAFAVHRLREDASTPGDAEAGVAQRLMALSRGIRPGPQASEASSDGSLLDQARHRLNAEIDHASRTV